MNFTMPNQNQSFNFDANNRNTCETSWKNEMANIELLNQATELPNHAKYNLATQALSRFAVVHNTYRNPMSDPLLFVHNPQPYNGYPQQPYPGYQQPMQQPGMGMWQQPVAYPGQFQQPMQSNHVVIQTNKSATHTLETEDGMVYGVKLHYQTQCGFMVEMSVIKDDEVLWTLEDSTLTAIYDTTEKYNSIDVPLVSGLVIQFTDAPIEAQAMLAKCFAKAFNTFIIPQEEAKAYASVCPTEVDDQIMDSILLELTEDQSKYLSIITRDVLRNIKTYPRKDVLMLDDDE